MVIVHMSFSSSSVPLNTVLNSYFPSTTKAAETRLFTKLGNSCVDLNTLYTAFFWYACLYVFQPIECLNHMNFYSADESLYLNSMSWNDYSHNNTWKCQRRIWVIWRIAKWNQDRHRNSKFTAELFWASNFLEVQRTNSFFGIVLCAWHEKYLHA